MDKAQNNTSNFSGQLASSDSDNLYSSEESSESIILQVKNISKNYPIQKGILKRTIGFNNILNSLSFNVHKGEVFAIVGESGCGKSTLSRLMMCLEKPTQGEIYYQNERIDNISHTQTKILRKEIQMVFQDSSAALNDRFSVEQILGEPLIIHKIGDNIERENLIDEVLQQVGLDSSFKSRYQHELSGGQSQRVAIARSIILKPKLLLLDEPLSALDVSLQRQLVGLFQKIQKELDLTIVLISHNLNLVRHISDRTLVLHFGEIAELRQTAELFSSPSHEYTKQLLASNLSY